MDIKFTLEVLMLCHRLDITIGIVEGYVKLII